jgi:hypothetical protein
MTKLRNMVGVAFVAMSLLTGFAVTAHADDATDQDAIVRSDEDRAIMDRDREQEIIIEK